MAWVAVDFDGEEYIYASKPERGEGYRCWQVASVRLLFNAVNLPKGSIKKLIGRELSWNDEPVELKED
nr:MAG TPA: RNA binding protein [Crassvirales sp.]